MSRTRLTLLWMLFVSGAAPAGDLAAEVRAVFAAKCAKCHGPDLAKPKGRFGYVLDLARVAANREMMVPGAPGEGWSAWRGSRTPAPAVHFCVALGAAGAVAAAALGWLLAWGGSGAGMPAALGLHRWLGTAAAVWAVAAALHSEREVRR